MQFFHSTKSLACIAGFTLFCFLLLTFFLYKGQFVSIDFRLLVKIQDRIPNTLHTLLANGLEFARVEISTGVLIVLLGILPSQKKRTRGMLFLLYVLGLCIVILGKQYIHHPAPPFLFQKQTSSFSFPLSYVHLQYSYPSGHTFRAVYIAVFCTLWALRRTRISFMTWAVIIPAVSFVVITVLGLLALGKHWPTDIVGGALLAISLVFFAYALSLSKLGNKKAFK